MSDPNDRTPTGLGATIWGCRGSVPHCTHQPTHLGGNTSCIEILHAGPTRLFIDAGTGIANAGTNESRNIHVLLTHYHWDHICGLPFSQILYSPDSAVTLYGPNSEAGDLEEAVQLCFDPRFSPIYSASNLPCELKYASSADTLQIDDLTISTFTASDLHPGGVWVIRISTKDHSIVVATDIELKEQANLHHLENIWRGADIVFADCQYSDDQYDKQQGWGHSSYGLAAALAAKTKTKRLVGFHHDPFKADREIAAMRDQARGKWPGITIDTAIEGTTYRC